MRNLKFEKASEVDINKIMNIIEIAQKHFKKEGIDQWQNNYPNPQVIRNDIYNDYSYVLKEEETILGTVALIFDGEETYKTIYNGQWLSDNKYGVIHRMAVDFNQRGTGLSSIFLKEIEELCVSKEIYSIKVDTHRDNIPMKRFLLKNGYKECGIIYLEDKSERIAYEKLLEGK